MRELGEVRPAGIGGQRPGPDGRTDQDLLPTVCKEEAASEVSRILAPARGRPTGDSPRRPARVTPGTDLSIQTRRRPFGRPRAPNRLAAVSHHAPPESSTMPPSLSAALTESSRSPPRPSGASEQPLKTVPCSSSTDRGFDNSISRGTGTAPTSDSITRCTTSARWLFQRIASKIGCSYCVVRESLWIRTPENQYWY